MKQDLHPALKTTRVVCNGCNTTWETKSTVDQITVEICSNCHPFYTGKQKLVDVAGRVDRFKAQQAAASAKKASKKTAKAKPGATKKDTTQKLKDLKKELEKPQANPAARTESDDSGQ